MTRRLERAGYEPQRQDFAFKSFEELGPPTFERLSPDPRIYADPADFSIMSYSGSGDVTGTLTPVDLALLPVGPANTSTSGCEAADFAGLPTGGIALMQRGTCPSGSRRPTRWRPARARP